MIQTVKANTNNKELISMLQPRTPGLVRNDDISFHEAIPAAPLESYLVCH